MTRPSSLPLTRNSQVTLIFGLSRAFGGDGRQRTRLRYIGGAVLENEVFLSEISGLPDRNLHVPLVQRHQTVLVPSVLLLCFPEVLYTRYHDAFLGRVLLDFNDFNF